MSSSLSALPFPVISDPALSTYDFCCFSTLQQSCPSVSKMVSSPSLNLSPFPSETPTCSLTYLLDPCALLFLYLTSSTVPLTLGSVPLGDFLFGLVYPETWVFGLVPVSVDSGARSKPMFMLLCLVSLCLLDSFPRSPGSCGPSSFQPWFPIPPHHD